MYTLQSAAADVNACNAVTGAALATADDCVQLLSETSGRAGQQACIYNTVVAPPATLAAIGDATAIDECRSQPGLCVALADCQRLRAHADEEFTCSRNLPQCVADEKDLTECLQACEDVSNKIAAFSAECLRLEELEEEAIDLASVTGTPIPDKTCQCSRSLGVFFRSLISVCCFTVTCFTLGGSRSLPAGYDLYGNRLGNGCAEPWCHQPHPSGAEGSGTPGTPQYQG